MRSLERGLVGLSMWAVVSCVACGSTTSNADPDELTAGSGGSGPVGTGATGGDGANGGSVTGSGGGGSPATASGGAGGSSSGTGGAGGTGGSEPVVPIPAPPCDDGEKVDLAPQETAERLAQLFWHQAAPDSLVEAAESDGLGTTGAVACFAREMLEDARADEGVADFFEGWLDIGKYESFQQDPEYVPDFSPEIVEAAHAEAVSFALRIWRSSKGTLAELLQSSYASVSEELAPFYGSGDETGWIDFGEERSGILTQLYYLVTRTSSAHGSPTQRGSDIDQMLGCLSIPPPPLVLESGVVPAEFEGTTRQWYEETHVTDPACTACHALMDRVGFALEHFDVMGRYRTSEAGVPIDATGWIYTTAGSPVEVTGHASAMQVLATSPEVRQCFASHFLGYALGSLRGERVYGQGLDREASADSLDYLVRRGSADEGFDLTELFLATVETREFLAP